MNKVTRVRIVNGGSSLPKKRPRNYNFTLQEKMHFLDILQEYVEITECRRLDTPMVAQKRKIWDTMAQRYNCMFPMGPQRDRNQLKDLYRRMKILARKVQKQRLAGLQEGELHLVSDEATERLIAMIFAPSGFVSGFAMDADENSGSEDVKPILLHSADGSSDGELVIADQNGFDDVELVMVQSPGSGVARKDEESGFVINDVKTLKRKSTWRTMERSKMTFNLPEEIEITPVSISMPLHSLDGNFPEMTTGSSFCSDERNDLQLLEQGNKKQGISSSVLNKELLKMAQEEHLMKMKVHKTSLELLLLQKRRLLQEMGEDG